MSSNLACVGLAVSSSAELRHLVSAVLPDAAPLGTANDIKVVRWQDRSGSRLIIGLHDGEVVDLCPSYAGTPGARLSNIRLANENVVLADVIDETGEQCTALAAELEQRRLHSLPAAAAGSRACVVALGVDVSLHRDAAAFRSSEASLMPGDDHEQHEPPPEVQERGLAWPPRMAGESFLSYGLFGSPEAAEPHAWMAGTVLRAERRTVARTQQHFIVARVRTVGFEADVCLAGTDHADLPAPDSIIAGHVFLVVSLASA